MPLSPKQAVKLIGDNCTEIIDCEGDFTIKFAIPSESKKIIAKLESVGAVVDKRGIDNTGIVGLTGDPTKFFPDVKIRKVKAKIKPVPKEAPVEKKEEPVKKEAQPKKESEDIVVKKKAKKTRRGIFGFKKKD